MCHRCRLPYPDELTTSVYVNGAYTQPICGICALAVINDELGIRRKRFQGALAEETRQRAISWRRAHPGTVPAK